MKKLKQIATEISIAALMLFTAATSVHAYATRELIAPTCTERGYEKTDINGEITIKYTEDALGHNWSDWKEVSRVRQPESNGEIITIYTLRRSCSRCKAEETREETGMVIAPATREETVPTCTEPGYSIVTTGSNVTKTKIAEPLGHNWSEWKETSHKSVTDADETVTTTYYFERTCSRCKEKETKTEQGVLIPPALYEVTEATCTEPGYGIETIGKKVTKTKIADPLGHSWSEWKETSAKKEIGDDNYTTTTHYYKHTCSRCGKTETKTEKTKEIETATWENKATCEEAGYKVTAVGKDIVSRKKVSEPLGHKWSVWKETDAKTKYDKDGGSETTNYYERTCSRCKKTETKTEVTALGPAASEEITKPTCTNPGYRIETIGNKTTKTEIKKALGHKWGSWKVTKAATTKAAGLKKRTCSRCGKTETTKIPKVKKTLTVKWKGQEVSEITLKKGKKATLKAVTSPTNIKGKVTYSSSKKSVATVKNGVVSAKKKGTATITVKWKGLRKTFKVKVK